MSEQHDYDGIKYREEQKSPGIFRVLLTVLIVWGVAFMGYYLFSGWSSQSEADAARKARTAMTQAAHEATEATTGHKPKGDAIETYVAAGAQLYKNLCVSCHGENAKGGVGPDLTVSKFKYGKSRLDLEKTIEEGRPGGMPAFKGQIKKEQVESLVEYVMTLK